MERQARCRAPGYAKDVRRGRGLRPRLRPPPPRRRASPCCGSPTSIGPRIDTPLTALLPAAGRPDRARLRRRGCSSCTRTTLLDVLAARHARRRRRHLQRRRRRRADALPGASAGSAGPSVPLPGFARRRARLGCSAQARRRRLLARAGRASSPSAGASTPPGCARCSASSPRTPPREAFADFAPLGRPGLARPPSGSRRRAAARRRADLGGGERRG